MLSLEWILRRLAAVAGGLIAIVLIAASSASAECGQDFRGAPRNSAIPGGPPLAIGDSVLADAVPRLVAYGFEADGMVCRQMSQGIAMLRNRHGHLPHLVVLALGTNGEATEREIDEALALLGPQRILVLVVPHGSVSPSTPGVIRAAGAASPNRILLLDWDRVADEHKDWLAPDGIHLGGSAGINGFAAMVADVLPYATAGSAESEGDNVDPGTPETLRSPPAHHRQARPSHRARTSAVPPHQSNGTLAPAGASTTPASSIAARSTESPGSGIPSRALIGGCVAALLALGGVLLLRRRRRARAGA